MTVMTWYSRSFSLDDDRVQIKSFSVFYFLAENWTLKTASGRSAHTQKYTLHNSYIIIFYIYAYALTRIHNCWYLGAQVAVI